MNTTLIVVLFLSSCMVVVVVVAERSVCVCVHRVCALCTMVLFWLRWPKSARICRRTVEQATRRLVQNRQQRQRFILFGNCFHLESLSERSIRNGEWQAHTYMRVSYENSGSRLAAAAAALLCSPAEERGEAAAASWQSGRGEREKTLFCAPLCMLWNSSSNLSRSASCSSGELQANSRRTPGEISFLFLSLARSLL